MPDFTPCQGKTSCRDDGVRCLTCGRSFEEIDRLRRLLDQMAELAMDYDYMNIDAYSEYIAYKINKIIRHRREQPDQ